MRLLQVDFEVFDLGGGTCLHDYLEIRHGTSESSDLFGVYCGGIGRQPPPVILTGETDGLYMEFKSSDELTTRNRGFKALYKMSEYIPISGVTVYPTPITGQCGGVYNLPETRFDGFGSPYHPGLYPPKSNCIYYIQAPEDHNIEKAMYVPSFETKIKPLLTQLVFTAFELEADSDCKSDSVVIEDDEDGIFALRLVGIYCGSFNNGTGYPPPTLVRTTSSNWAKVTFTSNNLDQFTGFYAQFWEVNESKEIEQTTISICNDIRRIVTDRGGLIVSHSGYDDDENYPNEDNLCVMRIQSDPQLNEMIHIDIESLDLRPSLSGPRDPVSGNFQSSDGALDIYFYTHFHEDGGNYEGFKIVYAAYARTIEFCGINDFNCKRDEWCIAAYLECDEYEHCRDGSDEWNCKGPQYVWLVTLLILLIFLIAVIIFVWAYDKCTKSQNS
ncbi:membrane frizzled-related protein-like, partial [Saccoglossus kowalevskii]